jgi:hypothetical protein
MLLQIGHLINQPTIFSDDDAIMYIHAYMRTCTSMLPSAVCQSKDGKHAVSDYVWAPKSIIYRAPVSLRASRMHV